MYVLQRCAGDVQHTVWYITMKQLSFGAFYFNICTLFSGARGAFLELSAAGHAGGLPLHRDASLGPGLGPWRVLWAFKVSKSGK